MLQKIAKVFIFFFITLFLAEVFSGVTLESLEVPHQEQLSENNPKNYSFQCIFEELNETEEQTQEKKIVIDLHSIRQISSRLNSEIQFTSFRNFTAKFKRAVISVPFYKSIHSFLI